MDKAQKEKWVQSNSAYVSTAMSLVSGIVGLFTIIPLGFISDKYGRKVGLFIAILGFAIESVMVGKLMIIMLAHCNWIILTNYKTTFISRINWEFFEYF